MPEGVPTKNLSQEYCNLTVCAQAYGAKLIAISHALYMHRHLLDHGTRDSEKRDLLEALDKVVEAAKFLRG